MEIKRTVEPRITPSMRSALKDLRLTRLDAVVHAGDCTLALSEKILAVAFGRLPEDVDPLG